MPFRISNLAVAKKEKFEKTLASITFDSIKNNEEFRIIVFKYIITHQKGALQPLHFKEIT